MQNNGSPVPVICADPSTMRAAEVFNPNDWEGASRGIVFSCWTELSVLLHGATRISEVCRASMDPCRRHVESLQQQWSAAPWDLKGFTYFVQVPGLHLLIEALFSGLKSMLDLIVQLLPTEAVVAGGLDGFHRDKGVYGGNVLNALEHNVSTRKKQQASAIRELIAEHKRLWIDEAITARHSMIHPTRGADQLMFEIRLEAAPSGTLSCLRALPPQIRGVPIDRYSTSRIEDVIDFARRFLERLRLDPAR